MGKKKNKKFKEDEALCDLKGHLKGDGRERFLELVRQPKYACRKCGRAARAERNLCKPIEL